jgi:ribosomal protein L11 methyltransferase
MLVRYPKTASQTTQQSIKVCMNYLELSIKVNAEFAEILMAELGEIGFESFTEESDGINAYIIEDQLDKTALATIFDQYKTMTAIDWELKEVEKQNWNEVWENSYEAIEVDNQCRVRASFHEPDPAFEYEIVINPKMSFGTGHHETTSMMLAHQLGIDHAQKSVLDVGSGTGILAIMAGLKGANYIVAFDIEEWAAENARENAELNNCPQIIVRQGTIQDEPQYKYDIVLANINRNILLREIPVYQTFMKDKALLLVSGFYENDAEDIAEMAQSVGLKQIGIKTKNNWASLVFELN